MSIKRIYQNIHISFSELSIIFVLAFIIRILNLLLIDDFKSHSFVEDSSLYWNGARYWIDSGFFSNISHVGYVAETERVPLYHLFLIFFQIIFGNEILPLLLGQVFVDSVSCVLIAKLGCYLSRQIGIISGICAAFSINLILHSSLILSETLFLFLMALFLLRCVNYIYRPSSYNAAIIGFICGCAIMTRTVSLLIPLAIFIALPAISSYLGKGWKSGVLAGITLLFFSIIPTTPIIYRNITNFDTLQLTSQTGAHFLHWVVGITKSLDEGKSFEEVNRELKKKHSVKIESASKQSAFIKSNQLSRIAREELSEMSLGSILRAWSYGAINNIMSPTVGLDPRIRKLNEHSFYQSPGHNILEKAIAFLSNNNPKYVILLSIGIIGSVYGG